MSDADFGGDLGIGSFDDSAFTDNSVFSTGTAGLDETALSGNNTFLTNYNANAIPASEKASDNVSADTTNNVENATADQASVNQFDALSNSIQSTGMMGAPQLSGQAATSFANYVQGQPTQAPAVPAGQTVQSAPNQLPNAAQQWAQRPLTASDLGPNPDAGAGSVQQMGINGGNAINPENSALYTPPNAASTFNTPNPTLPGQPLPFPGRPAGASSNLPDLDFTHRIMSNVMQGYGLSPAASAELAAISQKTGIGMGDVKNMTPDQILQHLVSNGASQDTIREVNKIATSKGQPLPIKTTGPTTQGTLFPPASAPTGLTPPPAAPTTAHPQPSAPQATAAAPASRWAAPQPAGSVQAQFQALGATPGEMETIHIESGFRPNQRAGSNVGYGQFSPDLMRRYGISNPDDPAQVLRGLRLERADFEKQLGRPVNDGEFYMMHQQGKAGGAALLRATKVNPTGTAWQTIRPFYPNDAIAKSAIWGNVPNTIKGKFGSVNNISNAQFASIYTSRFGNDAIPNNGTMVASNAPGRPVPPTGMPAAPVDDTIMATPAQVAAGRAGVGGTVDANGHPVADPAHPQTQFAANMQKLYGVGGYGALTAPRLNYPGMLHPAAPVKIAMGHRYAVDQTGRLVTTDPPTA